MLQSVKKRCLKKTKVIRFNPNIRLMFAKLETQKTILRIIKTTVLNDRTTFPMTKNCSAKY